VLTNCCTFAIGYDAFSAGMGWANFSIHGPHGTFVSKSVIGHI